MQRRIFFAFILFFLFAGSPLETDADPTLPSCAKTVLHLPQDEAQLLNSLAVIQNKEEIGSGVIISPDGYLLTAAHVVGPAQQVAVYLHSGDVLTGEVLGIDEAQDTALVKIPGRAFSCRPLQMNPPPTGTDIYGAGLTLRSQRVSYQMTAGQVTAASGTQLQTNADLPMGNSGGPFVNRRGEVLGLISWKQQPLGLNFSGSSSGLNGQRVRSYGASSLSLQRMLHAILLRH